MTESLRVKHGAGLPAGELTVLLHDDAADHGRPVPSRWSTKPCRSLGQVVHKYLGVP